LAAVLWVGVGTFLGGCASSQPKTADYNAQFASGRYSDAYENASKVASSLHAENRDQAALVAGLSARALGRNQEAKNWLTPLAANADAAIAGKACVALGSIAQEEGRHVEAADYFTRAGSRLPGDDAAHALMCAGDSLRALHKPQQAMAKYQEAKAKVVSDQHLRVEIGDRLAGGGPPMTAAAAVKPAGPTSPKASTARAGRFTVQTGAYASLNKAKALAKRYQAKGPAKTVALKDHSGRTVYAVQVGRYATRQDAEKVRQAVGNGAIVAEVVD
jgi:tetratricopeptide (TPR) repeat protein